MGNYDFRGGNISNGHEADARLRDDILHGRTLRQQNQALALRIGVGGASTLLGVTGGVVGAHHNAEERANQLASIPADDSRHAAAMWAEANAQHEAQDAGRAQGNQGAMAGLPVWMSGSSMKPGDAGIATAQQASQDIRANQAAQGTHIGGYVGDPQQHAQDGAAMAGMQSSLPRVASAQPTWGTQLAPGEVSPDDQALLQSPEEFR